MTACSDGYKTSTTVNYDSFGNTESERQAIEYDKWRIEYREIQRASRVLYNRRQVKKVVYPLGNRRFSLPRKAM